ncbi:MAG TPA: 4a-hydroxytetrahydrobiopterin dehydratase, partial [Dehalococcoidia bacterium]|nr:4a-hydroxytetrahydrobiopterin dehydratase [Dehalococcoidia bacterium]
VLFNENGIRKIKKQFKVSNFQEALTFTIKLGKLSEEEGHHPLLTLEWGKVSVVWWTHKIKDLHMNDFIMASKTDELFMKYY